MRLRKKHKEGAEVFTDALNDIMFFLLLFFLIIATMAVPNAIKVNLPSSKTQEQIQNQQDVVLHVSKDHRYFINQIEITFDALETALKAETNAKKTNTVILRLDQELTIQDLADVLQIGHNLQLKMLLATQKPR